MKKVVVIGCDSGSNLAQSITNRLGHDNIVFVESLDISEKDEFDIICDVSDTHLLEMIPRKFDIPFYPKAKHCRKGHERPYKFHK